MRNVGMLLCQVVDMDHSEPSLEFIEFLLGEEGIVGTVVLEAVDRGDDEVVVLGLDSYTLLFIFKRNRVLLSQSLPIVAQVLDILLLDVRLVDDLLASIVSEPASSILFENSQTFLLYDLPNIVVFTAAASAPNPQATELRVGVGLEFLLEPDQLRFFEGRI